MTKGRYKHVDIKYYKHTKQAKQTQNKHKETKRPRADIKQPKGDQNEHQEKGGGPFTYLCTGNHVLINSPQKKNTVW